MNEILIVLAANPELVAAVATLVLTGLAALAKKTRTKADDQAVEVLEDLYDEYTEKRNAKR